MSGRQREIVEAATRLFSSRGYAETTLTDIMGELGVSGAAFYYYYQSKEDILHEILDQALTRVEEELKRLETLTGLSSAQRLGLVLRAHAHAIATNAVSASVLFSEVRRARGEFATDIRVRMKKYTDRLVDMYQTGVETGHLRDTDPRLAVYCMLGQANWIASWYTRQPIADPDTIADLVGSSAMRAFAIAYDDELAVLHAARPTNAP